MSLRLEWKLYESYEQARDVEQCLYAFRVGDDVLYVGKAKRFGTRYSPGYRYLIAALLGAGHELYVAPLTPEQWQNVIAIEQTLISAWDPLTDQRRIEKPRYDVDTQIPWRPKE